MPNRCGRFELVSGGSDRHSLAESGDPNVAFDYRIGCSERHWRLRQNSGWRMLANMTPEERRALKAETREVSAALNDVRRSMTGWRFGKKREQSMELVLNPPPSVTIARRLMDMLRESGPQKRERLAALAGTTADDADLGQAIALGLADHHIMKDAVSGELCVRTGRGPPRAASAPQGPRGGAGVPAENHRLRPNQGRCCNGPDRKGIGFPRPILTRL